MYPNLKLTFRQHVGPDMGGSLRFTGTLSRCRHSWCHEWNGRSSKWKIMNWFDIDIPGNFYFPFAVFFSLGMERYKNVHSSRRILHIPRPSGDAHLLRTEINDRETHWRSWSFLSCFRLGLFWWRRLPVLKLTPLLICIKEEKIKLTLFTI